MPKNTVPAAGEAMPISTTRRFFLGGAAVASLPIAAVAMPAPETLLERRARLIAELCEVLSELTGKAIDVMDSPKNGVLALTESWEGHAA